MSYTKLFNSIITSTIWTEDDKTRILWITMLALADKNGEIQASIPGLARVAGMSVPDCESAIQKFLSPDPYSRTPDDEGRRIEIIPGGFALLNHGKYRAMASKEELREAEAERKRRYRVRDQRNGNEGNVPDLSQNVPDMSRNVPKNRHIAEAEADTEADPFKTNPNNLLSAEADGVTYSDFIETIWPIFPPMSRNRSSKAKLDKAWKATKSKPNQSAVISCLQKWAQSHAWTKDGGQFAQGAHVWIKDRKWESEPEQVTGRVGGEHKGLFEPELNEMGF